MFNIYANCKIELVDNHNCRYKEVYAKKQQKVFKNENTNQSNNQKVFNCH